MQKNVSLEKILIIAALMAGIGVIIMTLIIGYEVIMRYVFNHPTIWVSELSQFLMVFIAFLGLGYTELANKHIKVDLVINKMPLSTQRILRYTNSILTIVVCSLLAWMSFLRAFNYLHYRSSSDWAPFLFPVYIWIPVGYVLIVVAAMIRLRYGNVEHEQDILTTIGRTSS